MRFLLDESSDIRLGAHLRGLGHDVTTVAHDYSAALPDEQVLAIAQAEQRILITHDRDFGELIVRHRRPHAGVILFRLGSTRLAVQVARLDYVLRHHAHELDRLLVVTDRVVRRR